MEYEIAETPQLGEDDTYELCELYHRRQPRPAVVHPAVGEQHDRAVTIPEQETGS